MLRSRNLNPHGPLKDESKRKNLILSCVVSLRGFRCQKKRLVRSENLAVSNAEISNIRGFKKKTTNLDFVKPLLQKKYLEF